MLITHVPMKRNRVSHVEQVRVKLTGGGVSSLAAISYGTLHPYLLNRCVLDCFDATRARCCSSHEWCVCLGRECWSLWLTAAQCFQRTVAIQCNRSFSDTRPSNLGIYGNGDQTRRNRAWSLVHSTCSGGMGNDVARADTPMRTAKLSTHNLLNQYLRQEVVAWNDLDCF